ncbi:MAG: hypothetical protein ACYS22_06735, partial [Planctomycetota bacterium]
MRAQLTGILVISLVALVLLGGMASFLADQSPTVKVRSVVLKEHKVKIADVVDHPKGEPNAKARRLEILFEAAEPGTDAVGLGRSVALTAHRKGG